jgi:hypothetical protein
VLRVESLVVMRRWQRYDKNVNMQKGRRPILTRRRGRVNPESRWNANLLTGVRRRLTYTNLSLDGQFTTKLSDK